MRNTFTAAGKSATVVSMTSQLTPERSTSRRTKTDETRERVFLEPWFWMAVLCMIAMVLLVVFG
ncbi:hypothetical protein I553_8065 [Mycobacterium xenopi 4042]|uniref:Uncharacterized protein n=1 Tax=Mycobacterium xenopi 4042 TaxID=1299334 RepID=X8DCG4_MYCXE|nr:hypothetical protein I553_8065 [Mycobacterium xenopi 4042]